MNIGEAIEAMKHGKVVRRAGWSKTFSLRLVGGALTFNRNGIDSNWVAPHDDLLAHDWEEQVVVL